MTATKEIVEAGLAAGTEVARAEAKSLNEKALEKIKERGNVEIVELTPEQIEEFRKVLQPIYEEYEDEIGADVIEAALNAGK